MTIDEIFAALSCYIFRGFLWLYALFFLMVGGYALWHFGQVTKDMNLFASVWSLAFLLFGMGHGFIWLLMFRR